MDPHRLAELRSIAYHQVIAERLESHPAILEKARAWAETRGPSGVQHPGYAEAWLKLMAQPLETLKARLVEDSEEMRALRQSTPFPGALTAQERWRIHREVGALAQSPS